MNLFQNSSLNIFNWNARSTINATPNAGYGRDFSTFEAALDSNYISFPSFGSGKLYLKYSTNFADSFNSIEIANTSNSTFTNISMSYDYKYQVFANYRTLYGSQDYGVTWSKLAELQDIQASTNPYIRSQLQPVFISVFVNNSGKIMCAWNCTSFGNYYNSDIKSSYTIFSFNTLFSQDPGWEHDQNFIYSLSGSKIGDLNYISFGPPGNYSNDYFTRVGNFSQYYSENKDNVSCSADGSIICLSSNQTYGITISYNAGVNWQRIYPFGYQDAAHDKYVYVSPSGSYIICNSIYDQKIAISKNTGSSWKVKNVLLPIKIVSSFNGIKNLSCGNDFLPSYINNNYADFDIIP